MSALVLHLELDGFDVVAKTEVVRDVSGHDNNGTLVGDVDVVADDTFGACASFDGTSNHYIAVPSTATVKVTADVTLEAWVCIRGERTGWVRVVGKGTRNSSRSYGLWYQATETTTTWLFQRSAGSVFDDCEFTVTHSQPPFNTWYHLTGVVRGKTASLYLHDAQGRLIKQIEAATTLSGQQLDNDDPLTIGYGPDVPLRHHGRIAHVRLHHGHRTLAEIEDRVGRDRLALAAFRKSHPIDFRLYDDDDQAVMYISDDPDGHKLHLELRNTSTQVIQWHNGSGGAASAGNYHYAIRFRPGTLSDSVLHALVDSQTRATLLSETEKQDWDVYFPPQLPAANEPASLYLLYKGPAPKFALRPNESRTLTLQRMSAAPGSGARGTQVEFLPAPSTYAVDTSTPITGSRTQYVHVTNQRGRKNIPLHLWLTHGNTILNDGQSTTDLTLRISNGSDAHDITLETASRFVISFDVADDDWALTDSARADAIWATHGDLPLPDVSRGQADHRTTKEWELTFSEKKVLAKRGQRGEPLEITIGGITTNSSGHANLYVRYEGIPGYQDGQFVLTVEKSLLVCGSKRNVAINKNIDPRHLDHSAVPLRIFLPVAQHDGGTPPNGTADVLHLARAGVKDGSAGNKVSLAIGRYEHDGVKGRTQLDIKLTHDHFDDDKCVLSLRSNGHVGIGTTAPEQPLHVNGTLRIDGDRTVVNGFDGSGNHWIKTNGPQETAAVFLAFIGAPNGEAKAVRIAPGGTADGLFVRKDGRVGVGTTDPKESLHVKGNLRIDGANTVVNGFDDRGRHWIKTSATGDDKDAFMAFIGQPDGAAEAVQISPGGGGGGGLFVRRDGCVGIGDAAVLRTTAGSPKLEIVGSHKHSDNSADGTTIGEFYSHDRIQGVGISSNRIAAIGNGVPGHAGNQHLFLAPKGKGSVVVQGELLISDTHDLTIGGVLRSASTTEPVVIHCPDIADSGNDIPTKALKGRKNAIVFWMRGGDLNWMMADRNGNTHSTWRKSS